ncbi:hypothetical protein EN943_01765 [Mesorhizobium sp. M7A.F.Ca.US.006.01.1.1]|uniref:hypothetical protein n=1 Tax=Mesorhizobium sp. M7A.F.Ca.US.006.01.1.1 TaxID=2496707 RepID=UPI000FCB4E91|nr:hypothetical protein [Mesorhizobium sp. M7A.F.Ca.US.006.01.1.1]RUZ81168.1 hypothetical protein EN943_01765 [Mesorhizobium sp. M7A.F.Ca.US.006.01.1.1]
MTIALGSGLAFGTYMALADALLFRSAIPEWQTKVVAGISTVERIAFFAPKAIFDELKFRLIAVSVLVWILTTMAGRRGWCFWIAIIFTALVIYPVFQHGYLSTLAPTPLTVLREIMLHGGAGILWGYLYWRHGLVASVVGHVSAHLALQPLLGLLF